MDKIDVTKPLELSDGTPVELTDTDEELVRVSGDAFEIGFCWFDKNTGLPFKGYEMSGYAAGRTLRNRQEAPDPKLAERMVALVSDMAGASDVAAMTREARAIMSALNPKPKTDEEWARHLYEKLGFEGVSAIELAKAGIAKGRELERESGK